MIRALTLVIGLALTSLCCVGCGGGGDTHESLAGEGKGVMKQMVAVLDTVKDEASAKAAQPQLKTLAEKMNDINARQTKLPAPTEADVKTMDEKHGKEMEELGHQFQAHAMRIAFDPKLSAAMHGIDVKTK
jgi:hypothetical protein